MPDFVHLHLHSEYSIVDGLIRVKTLAEKTRERGMAAVALTDACNLFAMVKFYRSAVSQGIKPIIGADLWIAEGDKVSKLVLLCQNKTGYRHLCELISRAYQEGQYHGRPMVKKAWLLKKTKGLIALSGGVAGDVGQALLSQNQALAEQCLKNWHTAFPHAFYLELQRTARPEEEDYIHQVLELALKYDLPVVATNDVRFLDAEDFDAHEARVCIHSAHTLADETRQKHYSRAQYFRTPSEMAELFADIPEALENSVEIAKRCNLKFEFGENFLPKFPVEESITLNDFFVKEARRGLGKRLNSLFDTPSSDFPATQEKYQSRLEIELEVIRKMDFSGYFLVVADFIRWAKAHGIPVGPGRGSGAGSLVAYALEITDIDPIKYDLLFERFLNPERISMPDFDIDFCMEGRDRVIDYVAERYGRSNVSQIITYGTMAARAVIRDVGRVLGHPYGFVDKLAKLVPFEIGMTLEKALKQDEQLRGRYQEEEEVKSLIDLALKLEGLPRNAGKHAGGVVIAPKPLVEFMPLYCEEGSVGWVSQFDKDDVEAIGLVKFDFLGLRTLTIIDWAVQSVNARLKKEGQPLIDIQTISMEDEKTFELLKSCQTTAIFQLESQGIKDLIKRLQPDHFEEVVALVALYRPGPLQSGMVEDFINRKHGREKVTYLHPILEPILNPTYGVILYQEQVMQIAQELSGYTLGGADLLRRAMGKKKVEEMAKQRAIFAKGAEKNGVDPDVASTIFDIIEKFAGYGFNKSHSVAYALLSYQTAWLKAHYPAEFMSAVLSSDMDNTDKVVHFLEDCKQMGLTIIPPNLNSSQYEFTVNEQGEIVFGLGAIKGVGEAAAKTFIKERHDQGEFKDLFEFCRRVDTRKVNRKTLESLIYSGAMDSFGKSREVLMASVDIALQAADQFSKNRAIGQNDLFGAMEAHVNQQETPYQTAVRPWTNEKRLIGEKDTLGFYLSGHPIDRYLEELTCFTKPLREIKPTKKGQTILVAGFVLSLRVKNTKKGNRIAFLNMDDKTHKVDVIIFSDAFNHYRHLLIKDTLLIIEGEVSIDDYSGGYRVVAREIFTMMDARKKFCKQILFKINHDDMKYNIVNKIKQSLKPFCGGECPVSIHYQDGKKITKMLLGDEWKIHLDEQLIHHLNEHYGYEKVRIGY